jgi:NADPH-dependent curcumin reductase CurA
MLSFDPTQRGWMTRDTYIPKLPLGSLMLGIAVGQIIESRREGFEAGDLVQGGFGWQDYAIDDGRGVMPLMKLPPGTPPSLALGILGPTGLTGYFGTLEIGRPQEGETFVVSGAAGATGSVAGMIAKIQGCRVIGIAGGERKCSWLRDEGGFDEAIDYKNEGVKARLGELCPKGIDVYFDNVGGEILEAALDHLAQRARVVLCGAISGYEQHDQPPAPKNYFNLVFAQARMEGFLWMTFRPKMKEALEQLSAWHAEGRVQQLEDVQQGLENAPRTFMRLFSGANMGKQLLRLADPE